jgi:L-aminopeptidase/D-esterase-like protein
VIRGNRNPQSGERIHPLAELEQRIASGQFTSSPAGNTTLTLLIINQQLDTHALQQLARQVHSSMARAIVPFHTLMDGDIFYAVTTNEIDNPQLGVAALGLLASEIAWDVVLSIYE